jgi:hypothetical protein
LGCRGCVDVPHGHRVRGDDRTSEHPADGACGLVAASDRRSVDGLQRPEPTLRGGGGSGCPGEGAMTLT